jgi:hypothetical protein
VSASYTSEKQNTHRCEHPDCNVPISAGVAFCVPHWRKVPRPLGQALYRAWAVRKATVGKPAYQDAAKEHKAVKLECIKAIDVATGKSRDYETLEMA